MSHALVSKQLTTPTLPENQMVQLNAIMSRSDSSVPRNLEGSTEPSNGNPATQHPLASMEDRLMSSYPMFMPPTGTEGLMSYNLHGQSESMLNSVNVPQFTVIGHDVGLKPGLQPNYRQPKLSMQNKRKMMAESTNVNQLSQKMSASDNRIVQLQSRAKAPSAETFAPLKRLAQASAKPSGSGRKVVQIEAVAKKTAQPLVSPKSQTESSDSVRAKLRDSLASALALVLQKQESPSDQKTKMVDDAATTQEGMSGIKPLDIASRSGVAAPEPMSDKVSHASSGQFATDVRNDDKLSASATLLKEVSGEASLPESFQMTDFVSDTVIQDEDPTFSSSLYFKDELLQGNGLSWVSDFNSHIPEPEPMHEDRTSAEAVKEVGSPESLAFEIESELFKLFGGVNKKYKEKGRSLLFNLKDRNNPELREQVMSGAIPPDRLCSMTAEELASKELSQWRIAKAEELDHMKVLPEEVNMRRLVKKTHKGEYQVDLDPDYGVAEDGSAGVSVPPPSQPKRRKSNGAASLKAEQTKVDQCEITLPSEGDDMQGLMVEDMKDLPPVISLDEFMESLNKEPPFDNIPVNSETNMAEPDQEHLEVGSKENSRSPVESPVKPAQMMSKERLEVNVESPSKDTLRKSTASPRVSEPDAHKCDSVWEGELQVDLSSMVNFVALYKSGEKTSTRDWPRFFEIKGRVRLDAFDKFLQALPMSRSRAVMVCHFALKEGFLDSEHASLLELADSYTVHERLGFAEPAPGVELYLCPPRTKTVDMIIDRLPKSYTDKLVDIDDGLIGIVVWRKVQITSSVMSPVSSSQQKNLTNKQSRAQYVQSDMNRQNVSRSRPVPLPSPLSKSQSVDDEDDELPPGFGPPGSRDEDDLPEFKYSGGSHPSAMLVAERNPARSQVTGFQHHPHAQSQQVEQMRELIQKYGQNGNNGNGATNVIPIEPWNDDDDDIPEWQPQALNNRVTPPLQPVYNSVLQPQFANHLPNTANHATFPHPQWPSVAQPLQPPMGVPQQRAWDNIGGLPNRQYYGAPGPASGHVLNDRRSNTPTPRRRNA